MIRTLPNRDARRVLDRARGMVRLLGIDPHVPANAMHEEEVDAVVARVGGVPCPFLKDDACLIYNARPLTCRIHGLPIKGPSGEVLDPGCHLNFVGVDIERLPGYVLDLPAFDDAEASILDEAASAWGGPADPCAELFLPVALVEPWCRAERGTR